MDTERRTAWTVGVLFVVATLASILGSAALGSVLDDPDYLVTLAGHPARVRLAVVLFLVAATAAVATAYLLFPILRRHAEGLAASYAGLRTFENVFYVAGSLGLLTMLSVSQELGAGTPASEVQALGATLLSLHEWAVLLGTLVFFSLGSLVLNSVLYRARLVPRWLSVWGLVGAPLVLLYGVIGLFGGEMGLDSPFMLLAMPIAVQELVFAGWLIVEGFDGGPVTAEVGARGQAPLAR